MKKLSQRLAGGEVRGASQCTVSLTHRAESCKKLKRWRLCDTVFFVGTSAERPLQLCPTLSLVAQKQGKVGHKGGSLRLLDS